MFNWNDLVFFLELARQERLMPAARRLKVDHTTVSRRISELEKDLAVKLFERKSDGFVMTEDGHRLFALAERMEAQANAVNETVSTKASDLSGRVRIATMEGIAAYYLTQRLVEFNQLHPRILIELVTERHVTNLTKREADISISFVPPSGPRLDVRKAGDFRLGLQHVEQPMDLGDHDQIDNVIDEVVLLKLVHLLRDAALVQVSLG